MTRSPQFEMVAAADLRPAARAAFEATYHGRAYDSFFFSSRRRHTRSLRDWSSDMCSSDLGIVEYKWIFVGLALGAIIGVPLGEVAMTAVPQRTALSHAFGALCVTLVGTTEFYLR